MCEPSKVSDDWVTKGCHIHVDGVELAVFCDHKGGIGFRAVFSSTTSAQADAAVKKAIEECLPDPEIRKAWIVKLRAAKAFMLGYTGGLSQLANGRMFEFKMLEVAIQRWEKNSGKD
jgi:hypothetical protein